MRLLPCPAIPVRLSEQGLGWEARQSYLVLEDDFRRSQQYGVAARQSCVADTPRRACRFNRMRKQEGTGSPPDRMGLMIFVRVPPWRVRRRSLWRAWPLLLQFCRRVFGSRDRFAWSKSS